MGFWSDFGSGLAGGLLGQKPLASAALGAASGLLQGYGAKQQAKAQQDIMKQAASYMSPQKTLAAAQQLYAPFYGAAQGQPLDTPAGQAYATWFENFGQLPQEYINYQANILNQMAPTMMQQAMSQVGNVSGLTGALPMAVMANVNQQRQQNAFNNAMAQKALLDQNMQQLSGMEKGFIGSAQQGQAGQANIMAQAPAAPTWSSMLGQGLMGALWAASTLQPGKSPNIIPYGMNPYKPGVGDQSKAAQYGLSQPTWQPTQPPQQTQQQGGALPGATPGFAGPMSSTPWSINQTSTQQTPWQNQFLGS